MPRRWSGGTVFRDKHEAAATPRTRSPSSSATAPTTRSAGAWSSPTRRSTISRGNDPESAEAIRSHFARWDDIAVHYRGVRTVSGGHGFCGIGRRRLLMLLQERARALGVELRFETEIDDIPALMAEYDLVVAADGVNSKARAAFADIFRPEIDVRACKFVWLGTRQKFDDAFTFLFEKTAKGWMWAHAYQFDEDTATFIVECSEETWSAWGFDGMTQEESIGVCEAVFGKYLGGNRLISNAGHLRGSAWLNFNRVLCGRWSHGNLALLGDAAATAPLFHRLRHQAGPGERDPAGGAGERGAGPGSRPSRATRKNAGWRC